VFILLSKKNTGGALLFNPAQTKEKTMKARPLATLAFLAGIALLIVLGLGDAQPPLAKAQGFSCASVTEIPEAECEALVALYISTNGPGWSNNSGWLAGYEHAVQLVWGVMLVGTRGKHHVRIQQFERHDSCPIG
jgi:hypothetical protein